MHIEIINTNNNLKSEINQGLRLITSRPPPAGYRAPAEVARLLLSTNRICKSGASAYQSPKILRRG